MDFERLGLLLNRETGPMPTRVGPERHAHLQPPQLLVAADAADGPGNDRRPRAGVGVLPGLPQAAGARICAHRAVSIALSTGTPLQPAISADCSWVERE